MADQVKEVTTKVALSSVHFDHSWNGRSGGWMQQKHVEGDQEDGITPEHGMGLPGLIDSIKAVGQDDAIDVVPAASVKGWVGLKSKPSSKHEWVAVTGFRRGEAIRRIAEEGVNAPGIDPRNPLIKVNVKNLTEVEARARNGRENIERDNLSTADIAFIIYELGEVHKIASDTEIAIKLGKSQGYVSKLHRVMVKTKPSITKAWRENPIDPLTVEQRIKLADMPKDEQDEAYKGMLAEEPKKGAGQGGWMKSALAQAAQIGTLLGTLEREELIDTSNLDFETNVSTCKAGGILKVKGKKDESGATEKQWATLAKAMSDAHEAALNPPPEEVKEEKGNGKGAKAKGAEATA
jgi:ParB-like chromosome segregation protein Spo0J